MLKLGENYTVTITTNEVSLYVGTNNRAHGERRNVVGISYRSKSALLHFLNSVEFASYQFVTLTYRYNEQNWIKAYKDLRKWHKQMCYKFSPACSVWRQELQQRGAIHFHVFNIDTPTKWPKKALRDVWMDVTEQGGDTAARKYGVMTFETANLETKEAGVLLSYMTKYTTKCSGQTTGKAWGILGRKNAKEHRTTKELTWFQAYDLEVLLSEKGASKITLEDGGIYQRLYLGNIGGKQQNTAATDIFINKVKGAIDI